MNISGFYRSFEDRHRGSRDSILARLDVYLPFITPVLEAYPDALAIDLGCGRGEWLELLAKQGYSALGVDTDDGMLAACKELNLATLKSDIIDFLVNYPTQSAAVISAFHVAEHISFESLNVLVDEAKRILQPGGILILETPNPENISVATNTFYLDPTHQKPIPPLLLSFLLEFHNFEKVKLIRLQENPSLKEEEDVNLMAVLNGVSPDYAVVAQKGGDSELVEAVSKEFEKSIGLDLETLANRFDRSRKNTNNKIMEEMDLIIERVDAVEDGHLQVSRGISGAEKRLADLENRFSTMNSDQNKFDALEKTVNLLSKEYKATLETIVSLKEKWLEGHELILADGKNVHGMLEVISRENEHLVESIKLHADENRNLIENIRLHTIENNRLIENIRLHALESKELMQAVRALEKERDDLKNSLSWRITAPCRLGLQLFKAPVGCFKKIANISLSAIIELIRTPLSKIIKWVLKNPELSARINNWLIKKYPALHGHLKSINAPLSFVDNITSSQSIADENNIDVVTKRSRRIYQLLQENQMKRDK